MELKAEVSELTKAVETKDQKLKHFIVKESDQAKYLVELKKENERLKHSAEDSVAKVVDLLMVVEDLKRSNEGFKDTVAKMNDKVAKNQVKYLELVVKHEEMSKFMVKTTLKKSISDQFKCKQCIKSFQNKTNLEEHQQLHCNICGEIFKTILQLKKHENSSGHY